MERWGIAILVAGLLLAVTAMLYPVHFDPRGDASFPERFASRFDTQLIRHDSIVDIPRNIILFVPFGFGLGASLCQRKLGWKTVFVAVLAAGGGLSFAGETVQLWYQGRLSSLSDVAANGIGAVVGYVCFRLCGARILRFLTELTPHVKARLTLRVLLAGFGFYVTVILLVSTLLQRGAALSNWDPTFPLILGNELTGDRPWRGRMSEVHFADRAITGAQVASLFSDRDPGAVIGDALVVSYQLTDGGSLRDLTGHLSDLSWRGSPPSIQDARGVALAPDHWLVSGKPAAFLTGRLIETSQFTLITTVATADQGQWGPARIVSISQDPTYRNLTLGQEGTDLVLRVRTRLGLNGARPAVIVPGVFADQEFHRVILTYDSGALQVYIDGPERSYAIALTPDLTFFHLLAGTLWWDARPHSASMWIYPLLYYGLLFVPAGLLLALAAALGRRHCGFSSLWIWAAILLPCTALEVILATTRGMKPQNLLLSVVMAAGAMLLLKAPAERFFQSDCRG